LRIETLDWLWIKDKVLELVSRTSFNSLEIVTRSIDVLKDLMCSIESDTNLKLKLTYLWQHNSIYPNDLSIDESQQHFVRFMTVIQDFEYVHLNLGSRNPVKKAQYHHCCRASIGNPRSSNSSRISLTCHMSWAFLSSYQSAGQLSSIWKYPATNLAKCRIPFIRF